METRTTFEPDQGGRAEAAEIEALMREPVKPPPSIIVIGDDDVFAITPPKPA